MTTLVPDDYQGRYRTDGIVLESRRHGPQLCDVVVDTNPPQCDGLDIVGWSWQHVAHETASGTSWGRYVLVGTYDGKRFRLTEPVRPDPEPVPRSRPQADFSSRCSPPPGGWAVVDRATATDAGLTAAIARAAKHPGYAGAWLDQNGSTDLNANHPTVIVLNVRYTKNLAAHEADLRRVWGGALCVSKAKRTLKTLERIARELTDRDKRIEASADVLTNTVGVDLYLARAAWQRELDQRYGPGVVRLFGMFQPID